VKPPGYYELFDLVSLQFPVVRMIGQAPFVGYTLADFAAGSDPDVSVDTSLLDVTEEPEWFIAVASERPVVLEPFMVVELPFAEVGEGLRAPEARGAPPAERLALADAEARVAALSAELDKLRERRREDVRQVEAQEAQAARASSRVLELEGEMEATGQRFKDAELRAGDAHVRAERLTHQIRDMEEELRHQRDRATRLSKQLDDEKKSRTRAEVELGLVKGRSEVPGGKERIEALAGELESARARIDELLAAQVTAPEAPSEPSEEASLSVESPRGPAAETPAVVVDPGFAARVAELEASLDAADLRAREAVAEAREAQAPDVAVLEAALRERGHRVAALERDLRESERVGRELVGELHGLRAEVAAGLAAEPLAPPAQGQDAELLKAQLDLLSQTAAKSLADLQAASWRVTQLERELDDARRDGAEPSRVQEELEQALLAAHQEIASLRRALVADRSDVLRDVTEQSVLLHQVAPLPGAEASTNP
jgi:chromosome segregation ATPase